LKWSAISLTVLAPLRKSSERIAALVGRDRTFAVLVAESSPRFAMERYRYQVFAHFATEE
jgi:hypothetical protein